MPTYHLANIVDDHLMETYVIRGEEWVTVCRYTFYYTELLVGMHLNLHTSLILKPVGNGKLSKRDGDKLVPSIPIRMENEEGISSGYREKDFPRSSC
jgi:glutamyl-tRNA synthetase